MQNIELLADTRECTQVFIADYNSIKIYRKKLYYIPMIKWTTYY